MRFAGTVAGRGFIRSVAAALFVAAAQGAWAQAYPVKPVRLVVTQAPGGAPDIIARLVADRMGQGLGQGVVVENRAGGANVIGAQAVARSAPDGYTILFATAAALVTNPHTLKSVPYDALKDFVPIGMVGRNPFLVLVNRDVPAKTLAELVALDRKEPGRLAYATDGPRNFSGMVAAWLNKLADAKMSVVPYAAMPQGVQDTVAGRTQVVILAPAAANAFVKRGDLRAIAQTWATRAPGFEDVPTVADTFAGFDFVGWFALAAPAGTPADVVQRLNGALDAALRDPAVAERLRSFGVFNDGAETPQATADYIRAQHAMWGRLVREIGLQPE
jgi:tripartite-type tricarboxylate transporter receptor subunit TctC